MLICLSTAADITTCPWFAGRDIAKHKAQGDIAWLTGSDFRTSSNFA